MTEKETCSAHDEQMLVFHNNDIQTHVSSMYLSEGVKYTFKLDVLLSVLKKKSAHLLSLSWEQIK